MTNKQIGQITKAIIVLLLLGAAIVNTILGNDLWAIFFFIYGLVYEVWSDVKDIKKSMGL